MSRRKQKEIRTRPIRLQGTGQPASLDVTAPKDADGIAIDDFPITPFPGESSLRKPGFQVICRETALIAIRSHGEETTKVEVCGVLVGNLYRDESGPYLLIEECIRGENASSHLAQVTFTSATWTHIHEQMERFPSQRIVGWYHTHPDFGIFLSPPDLFIHESFFALSWQVAYVYDPVRKEDGLFIWRKGIPQREPLLVWEVSGKEPVIQVKSQSQLKPLSSLPLEEMERRLTRLERRLLLVTMLVVAVLTAVSGAVLFGWSWFAANGAPFNTSSKIDTILTRETEAL